MTRLSLEQKWVELNKKETISIWWFLRKYSPNLYKRFYTVSIMFEVLDLVEYTDEELYLLFSLSLNILLDDNEELL